MLIIYVQGDLTIGCDRYFLTLKEYPGTIMIYERGVWREREEGQSMIHANLKAQLTITQIEGTETQAETQDDEKRRITDDSYLAEI